MLFKMFPILSILYYYNIGYLLFLQKNRRSYISLLFLLFDINNTLLILWET